MRSARKYALIVGALLIALYVGWEARGRARGVLDALAARQANAPVASSLSIPKGYRPLPCPADAFAVGIFGQSNSSNSVIPLSKRPYPVNLYQYDWKSDACYLLREPLLGADGSDSNVVSFVGADLAVRMKRDVIVIPFGRGGTSISTWSQGALMRQHTLVLSRLSSRGLAPDVFLWHQGEADHGLVAAAEIDRRLIYSPYFEATRVDLFKNTDAFYRAGLHAIVQRTYAAFPSTRFGIALVSRCNGGREIPNELLRSAQRSVASANARSFVSADSDSIWGEDYRYDACHFTALGARKLANLYTDSILKAVSIPPPGD